MATGQDLRENSGRWMKAGLAGLDMTYAHEVLNLRIRNKTFTKQGMGNKHLSMKVWNLKYLYCLQV